jgi:hypothetical protein
LSSTVRRWAADARRYLHGGNGKHVKGHIASKRIAARSSEDSSEDPGGDSAEAEDPFLILVTSGIDLEKAPALYEERWQIETLFAALKSRRYNLEHTHLTKPERIQRLIGLLALAFEWTSVVGERRIPREGPPREKAHERRQRSLFRYGLDRLRGILTTPEPQPTAFVECLRVLRSPTAFLSCT